MKMHMKTSSANLWPFCQRGDELNQITYIYTNVNSHTLYMSPTDLHPNELMKKICITGYAETFLAGSELETNNTK